MSFTGGGLFDSPFGDFFRRGLPPFEEEVMPTSGQPPAPKVNVSVEIKTMVEISNSRYLSEKETVEKHLELAQEQAKLWQWFVKKGATEPEPIGVRIRVVGVTILPQEST